MQEAFLIEKTMPVYKNRHCTSKDVVASYIGSRNKLETISTVSKEAEINYGKVLLLEYHVALKTEASLCVLTYAKIN